MLNLAKASRTLLGVVFDSAPGVADFWPLESKLRANDEADPIVDATLEVETLLPDLGCGNVEELPGPGDLDGLGLFEKLILKTRTNLIYVKFTFG